MDELRYTLLVFEKSSAPSQDLRSCPVVCSYYFPYISFIINSWFIRKVRFIRVLFFWRILIKNHWTEQIVALIKLGGWHVK